MFSRIKSKTFVNCRGPSHSPQFYPATAYRGWPFHSLEVIIAKESSDASVEYRDAERALYGLSVSRLEEEISLGEISNVLPDVNGRAWTGACFAMIALLSLTICCAAIFDRAFKGSVDRLQAYDEETMAAALFSRVYNVSLNCACWYYSNAYLAKLFLRSALEELSTTRMSARARWRI